jgi:fumarate reductase flavoprotein subunit
MGGIRTDAHGQAYGLRGLFACGEAACWDLHGFNRLGGNSVAETVVAGMIVGETMADFVESAAATCRFPPPSCGSSSNRASAGSTLADNGSENARR